MATEKKKGREFNRTDVLASLLMVKPALGRGMFVPVLSHLVLDGEGVTAYDDVVAMRAPLSTGFACIVPGDLMLRLLGTMVAEGMDMELKDDKLQVRCGKSKVDLPTMPMAAALFRHDALDSKKALGRIKVTADFLNGLTKCLLAVGNDPTHPAQMGVTLMWDDSEGGGASMYSTDNVTLSEYALEDVDADFLPDGVVFPTSFCQQVVSLCAQIKDEDRALTLYKDSAVLRFSNTENVLLFCKLVAVEKALDFPSMFNKMMPKANHKPDRLPPSWDAAFTRASVVVDPLRPITLVECEDDMIKLDSTSQVAKVADALEFEGGLGMQCKPFGIDPQHVLRASKVCSRVSFQPRALVLHDDGPFTHLISHCED